MTYYVAWHATPHECTQALCILLKKQSSAKHNTLIVPAAAGHVSCCKTHSLTTLNP
jgi:hypothetical protein